MRIQICAVGRLRRGPERILVDDYLSRFDKTGRPLGLGPAHENQVDDRKSGGVEAQAALLGRAIPDGAVVWALDERGSRLSSPEFAAQLALCRDNGARDVAILIGGADGLASDLRASAHKQISFGAMVWPHMLARVMLAEQLYRAATILAGGPYHRA
ncbi:MAG: 23S rRNA (pseudouridine(1915)-N(3))-methyltransferase RlmH [Pseudomonadota bacterium]